MPDEKKADALLKEVQKARQGRLKIFFGAAPGVGKTYAMLQEVREKRASGLDVLIGWVDTHGRKDTQALLEGLTVLPRKKIRQRGFVYEEFDIDEVLRRHPALVVVDELAHTNAPGSRHPKRWQDVEELLAVGINVYTAVNVQHLESLNAVVEKLTGVEVRETVPDRIFDEADEVRLVDLPPADLIARLKAGKIYVRETINRALGGFFKKQNLLALRELALRRMAARAGGEATADRGSVDALAAATGVLVWIAHEKGARNLIREGARMAAGMQSSFHVVWMETGFVSEKTRVRIMRNLQLADDLGAVTQVLEGYDPVAALSYYARTHGLQTLIAARGTLGWWKRKRLAHLAPDLRIMDFSPDAPDDDDDEDDEDVPVRALLERDGWWQAVLACAFVAAICYPLQRLLDPANLVMMYLLPILFAALRYGRGPACLAAVASAVTYSVLCIEPRFTFDAANVQFLIMVLVMLGVAWSTGSLVRRLRDMTMQANVRTVHMRALFTLSKELGRVLQQDEITGALEKLMKEDLDARVDLWLYDEKQEGVEHLSGKVPNVDRGIVAWCVEHGEAAGSSTHTLPQSPYLYVPMKGRTRTHGVIVFAGTDPDTWMDPERKSVALAATDLAAMAFERLHYADMGQKTSLEMESERLRHSLVRELSHDLREPLMQISEGTEALWRRLTARGAPEADEARELLDSARRMGRLTNNLLEMSRLQAGNVELHCDWVGVDDLVTAAIGQMPDSLTTDFMVQTEVQPDCPLLYVDAQLLDTVLVNLLDNAMKYCPKGSTIRIAARRAANNVVLTVADNGPGLPPGEEQALFDPFRRGHKASVEGVGLGLAICRSIARVHGAQILAANRPTGGAVFTLIIPVKDPEAVAKEEAKAAAKKAILEKKQQEASAQEQEKSLQETPQAGEEEAPPQAVAPDTPQKE